MDVDIRVSKMPMMIKYAQSGNDVDNGNDETQKKAMAKRHGSVCPLIIEAMEMMRMIVVG